MGKIRKHGFGRLGEQVNPDFDKKSRDQSVSQPGQEKRKEGRTGPLKKGDRLKENGKAGKGDEKSDQNKVVFLRRADTAGGHLQKTGGPGKQKAVGFDECGKHLRNGGE